MLKTLKISNKKISIENIEILTYLKKFNNIKFNELEIYIIPEIYFCGSAGRLTIYLKNGSIYKMLFSVINAHNVFGISPDFDAYNTFYREMCENYRQQDENTFYNKKFIFKLVKTDNNFFVTIGGRNYEADEI